THYSPALGEMNFRRAVADLESRTSPHHCSPDNVAIFPGGTSAIHAVMSCLLDAGDEVIIPDPMYVGYPGIMAGLNVKIVSVKTDPANNFKVDCAALVAAVTPRTRVVFINTPNNPTGSIIDQETLRELAAFCHEKNLWLVCDEMYSMFTYEKRHVSLRAAAEQLDNVVMIDGLSKSHAMSGWRMGWVVAPLELMPHLENFSANTLFGCTQFIQDAAAFALSNDEYYVDEMRAEYKIRRDLVVNRVNEIPGLSCKTPESGMFVMVNVAKLTDDDMQFAGDLLEAERVSVVPGSAFGSSTSGHLRVSLVQPPHVLKEGCERLARFALAQNELSGAQA
ncbi:MAG: arginine:pyruvate transaminase, partial [Halieaceae bacterium]